jgi:hypothetical protein
MPEQNIGNLAGNPDKPDYSEDTLEEQNIGLRKSIIGTLQLVLSTFDLYTSPEERQNIEAMIEQLNYEIKATQKILER